MAKRSNDPPHNAEKAKVRIIFAEVEGNNDSIQEALKTMVSAISRPVRIVSDSRISGTSSALLESVGSEPVHHVIDEVAETSEDLPEDTAPSVISKGARRRKKTDRNSSLSLVQDVDFRPQGKKTFKDFLEEKSPKNDLEACLAYVFYFQNVLGLAKVGASHVMTAFKEAGKPCPVDLKQTIRNVHNNKIWLKFSDLDDIKTTTQGENFINYEMGKAEKS